jgi:phosphoribosylanthranilate isomerase
MNENFVCVSGVTRDIELGWVADDIQKHHLNYRAAIGFQVSNSSINNGTTNERQPNFENLGRLDGLAREYGLIPAIHYFTKDNETILGDLETIAKNIDMTHGSTLLQFNTLPVEINILKEVEKMGFDTIFKIPVSNKGAGGYAVWKGDGVQDVSSGDVGPLIEHAREVAPYVRYVMFDASHGTNLELDLGEDSLPIRFGKGIRELREMDNVGLVYAGGFNPDNIYDKITALEKHLFGGVSVDIESGVMGSDGKLDKVNVRDYFVNVGWLRDYNF